MLNQDMYLEPNAVEEMVRFMESHRKCGIGTPLQLSGKVPGYVVHAGCLEAFPTGQHQHGWLSEFTKDEPVFWGNGACMILRKEMIREIGLFDSNYVLVGSDSDYCFTARSRGWQVWRIAGARGIHEGGVTGRIVGKEIEILKLKDMTYFAKKWLTGQLYKQLSCEGRHYTPEMIDEMMARIRAAKTKLEGSEAMEVGQAQ
jgi:GT2 family glycosyltransferase